MDLESELEKIGLSQTESIVYTSTLKEGIAKASNIAVKSKLKREAVYYILKQLKEKGFVSEVIKGGVKHYSAVNPKRILEIIEEEKENKQRILNNILPQLNLICNTSLEKPTIEVYEGVDGFKTISSKIIEKQNQELCLYVEPDILEFMPYFHVAFRRKRREQNVRLKVITKKTKITIAEKKRDNDELREIKFCDKIMNDINCLLYILDDAIIIIKANKQEQIGIYIKEENIVKLQRNIFEVIWDSLK